MDLFGHEAPPVEPGFVEITSELRKDMHDAIAIVAKDAAGVIRLNSSREPWVWLAKSEIKSIDRGKGNSVRVVIPTWLAEAKGLL